MANKKDTTTKGYNTSVKQEPRSIHGEIVWAYYSPDGHLQVRSISDTKKEAGLNLVADTDDTVKQYEAAGFVARKLILTAIPL